MKLSILLVLLIALPAHGSNWNNHDHDEHTVQQTVNEYNTYETYQVTQTINATDEQVAQAMEAVLTASVVDPYQVDHCQGVAISQAGSNNMMHLGSKKPQVSLGLGECGGEVASSLMFGMRLNRNMLLNGSWAQDEDVDAYGLGLNVVFP